jgi:hypothetical protein
MKKENWKCIPGYSKYIASNTGKIMRLPQLALNQTSKVSGKTNGRCGMVLSPRALPSTGHLQVFIANDNGKRTMQYVHRLVALAWIKKRPGKELVLHKDDNPNNNVVTNLKWGTHYMNSQMITIRNTAKTRGKYMDNMEKATKLYHANKDSYSGKAKDLVKEIANDMGISVAYVYLLIYNPKAKQFIK